MLTESSLYKPIVVGANKENWSLYRIGDSPYGRKPFDIGGADPDGRSVAIEVKIATAFNGQIFPWDSFEAHQLTWIKRINEVNGIGLLAIYEVSTSKMFLFWPKGDQIGRANLFMIPKCIIKGSTSKEFYGWNVAMEDMRKQRG